MHSDDDVHSYAMPLYLQAISILIPPPPQISSAEDQCRAAQLMGNISELILRTRNDPEAIVQAESWANKGLEVASRVRKSTLVKHPSCEVAYAYMLYNLGMIRDVRCFKLSTPLTCFSSMILTSMILLDGRRLELGSSIVC